MRLRDGVLASPTLRTALSLASLSAWLVLLFAGWSDWLGGGAVHLLFAASLALFPWRALRVGGQDGPPDPAPAPEDEPS